MRSIPCRRQFVILGAFPRLPPRCRHTLTLPAVLVAPVLHHRIAGFGEPLLITAQLFERCGQKVLLAVVRRTAQRFQQTSTHQNRDFVR